MDTFGIIGTRWLAESTASYGADFAFPGADTYSAPYGVTPGVPLNIFFDIETSPHFLSDAMSLSDDIRGGHVYAAFPFWSFLANHAGLPNLVGKRNGTAVYYKGRKALERKCLARSDSYCLQSEFGIISIYLLTNIS